MELQILSELTNNHVIEINKTLKELEDIDSRIKNIDQDTTVCLYTEINGKPVGTTKIHDLLSPGLMAELETKVLSAMERERYERESRLLQLIQYQEEPDEKIDTTALEKKIAISEVAKEDKRKTVGRKTVELDEGVVKDLYVNKGYSYRKVAEHCGCAEGTVYNFIKKNGITREEAQVVEKENTYPEMTEDEVKKVYTNGSMSLAEAAKYFGVKSKELHSFVEKHGLKKPVVKKNNPFRDDIMSKEEFRAKMLADRRK